MTRIVSQSYEVKTIEGDIHPREDCRLIGGKYYLMDRDCFLLKNPNGRKQWYRKGFKTGLNFETQKWERIEELRAKGLVYGVIDTSGTKGYFKPFFYKTVIAEVDGERFYCLYRSIAKKMGLSEDNDSIWRVNGKCKKQIYEHHININYNTGDKNKFFLEAINHYLSHNSSYEGMDTLRLLKYLKDYTFGIEFETCEGTLPIKTLKQIGLVPLKDGSSAPPGAYEYATIPLGQAKGLIHLKYICDELTANTQVDKRGSTHIHIGGYKRDRKNLVKLYYTLSSLQEEWWNYFPKFRKFTDEMVDYHGGHSGKNYNQALPSLNLSKHGFKTERSWELAMDKIFSFLCGGHDSKILREKGYTFDNAVNNHPQGNKWHRTARYYQTNLVPYVFDKKATIECRMSHAITNFTKVSNLLFTNIAIIEFANKKVEEFMISKKSFSLSDILNWYFQEDRDIAEYLKAYWTYNKEKFTKSNDYGGDELQNNQTFSFEYNGMKELY
jgi:transcription termination factor NusB